MYAARFLPSHAQVLSALVGPRHVAEEPTPCTYCDTFYDADATFRTHAGFSVCAHCEDRLMSWGRSANAVLTANTLFNHGNKES